MVASFDHLWCGGVARDPWARSTGAAGYRAECRELRAEGKTALAEPVAPGISASMVAKIVES